MAKLDWPQAAVMVALVLAVAAVCLFAPEDLRAPIAALITASAGILRSPASRVDP